MEKEIKSNENNKSIEQELEQRNNNNNNNSQKIISFPTNCVLCHSMTETTNMCVINIPHFKEIIIMSYNCDKCGYKSNEIKAGSNGLISDFGTKLILTVQNENDLTRDVIKSDTAGIEIPELELILEEGGMGGLYTTVQGLLLKIYNQLKEVNPFAPTASATIDDNDSTLKNQNDIQNYSCYVQMLDRIKNMSDGKEFPFTFIINDPLSNSFISPCPIIMNKEEDNNNHHNHNTTMHQSPIHEQMRVAGSDDNNLITETFIRSHEQNEILGLNDIQNI